MEVPTVVSLSLCSELPSRALTFQVLVGGGGLQGLLPGQNSTTLVSMRIADIPVPHGGLPEFHPGQGSRELLPQVLAKQKHTFYVRNNTTTTHNNNNNSTTQQHNTTTQQHNSHCGRGFWWVFFALSRELKKCGVRQPVRRSPPRLFFT